MIIAKSAREGATTPTDGTAHRRTIEAGNRLLIALDDERKNRVSGLTQTVTTIEARTTLSLAGARAASRANSMRPRSFGSLSSSARPSLSRGIPEVNTPQESREVLPLGMVSIEVAEETLWLLPERAAFWPARGMLFVADAHIGKAAAFRSAGIAIPAGTTASDLDCLSRLIEQLGARRIAFLGDLLHSRQGRQPRTLESFHAWRERHAEIEMLLIRGNHDRRAGDPPAEWGIVCTDPPLVVGAFALCHDPQPVAGHYSLAGHVHPAVCMTGRGRERTRLPCFLLRADYAILPAFGGLTGMFTVTPEIGDRVYVVAGDTVVPAR